MAKVWVELVAEVSPDGDPMKALLTKSVKEKVEKQLAEKTAAVLPSNYSSDKGAKPKGKTNDYSPRAVRIVEKLTFKVEPLGKKLYTDGTLTMIVSLLTLKKAKEDGELAKTTSKGIQNLDLPGAMDTHFDAAVAQLLDKLVEPLIKKTLDSSFEKGAREKGLPI